MTSAYQQIMVLLDRLAPAELAALMGEVAQRLQGVVGEPENDNEGEEGPRRYLPRLPHMVKWGVVVPMEDKLFVQGHQDKPALLLDGYRVAFNGQPMGINDWAKLVTGWKAVNIYEWVIVERAGRTLNELRHEYMQQHGLE